MRRAAVLVLASVAIALAAQESVSTMITLADFTSARGRRLVWEISGEAAKAVPRWDADKDALPLSAGEAVAIAKKWAKSRCRSCDALAIEEIRLAPMPVPDFQDRWYYTIFLTPVVYGAHQYENDITVVVLLNKNVVEPKEKEPRAYE